MKMSVLELIFGMLSLTLFKWFEISVVLELLLSEIVILRLGNVDR